MWPYLGPSWTDSHQIWAADVFSVSNKHKFQRAFWARGLKSFRALTNVCGPKGNNLNLKAYKINAWISLISSASCVSWIFKGLLGPYISFSGALLNFQGMRAQEPFLFETLDVFHHAPPIYGIQNAEMQKKKREKFFVMSSFLYSIGLNDMLQKIQNFFGGKLFEDQLQITWRWWVENILWYANFNCPYLKIGLCDLVPCFFEVHHIGLQIM